ncbi:hypothetical protein DLD77_02725 [Chitinophaga alhagiae]|uniref:HTH HARE-type domain-containing protein n=1 Tax=Chitinophaga alhagiae TaxID=2203219 RepID=A0ABM6W9N9_9BACT|nr:HTH domain-containing protein [Chitinophaga alhagiae]AWO00685.1 hypothetical protein DLD77_02725 [Chitinophaga alhagiae]
MKWIDAIIKVLQEEGKSMHYEEIAQKILDKNFRTKVGATPAATVVSIITTDINQKKEESAFIRVGLGEYFLRHSTQVIISPEVVSAEEEIEEQKKIDEAVKEFTDQGIIKTFGMYWSRDYILWKNNPTLYGAEQRGSTPVNFGSQIGIYLLHDGRDVIYIGQALEQSIAQRLYQHTSDRLGGRWNRFSWFGLRGVKQNGILTDIASQLTTSLSELTNTLEAILVEALEPRQNRKRGNMFYGLEFIQEKDPELSKRDMVSLLDDMKEQLIKR